MFENVGEKLKTLARLLFTLGFVAGLILAVISICNGNFLAGILFLAGYSLLGWLSSVGLYAFGQLVENSEDSARHLREMQTTMRKILHAVEAKENQSK